MRSEKDKDNQTTAKGDERADKMRETGNRLERTARLEMANKKPPLIAARATASPQ